MSPSVAAICRAGSAAGLLGAGAGLGLGFDCTAAEGAAGGVEAGFATLGALSCFTGWAAAGAGAGAGAGREAAGVSALAGCAEGSAAGVLRSAGWACSLLAGSLLTGAAARSLPGRRDSLAGLRSAFASAAGVVEAGDGALISGALSLDGAPPDDEPPALSPLSV